MCLLCKTSLEEANAIKINTGEKKSTIQIFVAMPNETPASKPRRENQLK